MSNDGVYINGTFWSKKRLISRGMGAVIQKNFSPDDWNLMDAGVLADSIVFARNTSPAANEAIAASHYYGSPLSSRLMGMLAAVKCGLGPAGFKASWYGVGNNSSVIGKVTDFLGDGLAAGTGLILEQTESDVDYKTVDNVDVDNPNMSTDDPEAVLVRTNSCTIRPYAYYNHYLDVSGGSDGLSNGWL